MNTPKDPGARLCIERDPKSREGVKSEFFGSTIDMMAFIAILSYSAMGALIKDGTPAQQAAVAIQAQSAIGLENYLKETAGNGRKS